MNKRSKLAALFGAAVMSLAVAGVALATTYDWQGNGWPNDKCSTDESSLPATMYWIWTGDSPTSLTINGEVQSGSWVKNGGGSSSYHFVATVDGTDYPPVSASIDYTGDAGTLTLSHCDGSASSPSPTAPESTGTPQPSFSGGRGGDTNQPTQPSTDAIGSTGSSGPAGSAWLLVVALGVLLASIVVLTPARSKTRR